MKISKLISELKRFHKSYGDVEIVMDMLSVDGHCSDDEALLDIVVDGLVVGETVYDRGFRRKTKFVLLTNGSYTPDQTFKAKLAAGEVVF